MSDLFPVNPNRVDPYKNYAFHVFLGGNATPAAGVHGVGPVRRYLFYRCWVSEYQALPFLDAGRSATTFEHITIENEGWERDTTLTEPQER